MGNRQPAGSKGSQKWLRHLVYHRPDMLQPTSFARLKWKSPVQETNHAEFMDGAFLEAVGFGNLTPALAKFWPKSGPRWDGLAIAPGQVVLVEAKSHLSEFRSKATKATGASLERIQAAMAAVKADLGVVSEVNWTGRYYQYTNRIAHLWWLRGQQVDAHLFLVGFLNDPDMKAVRLANEWTQAYAEADRALGLAEVHPLSSFIHHLAPDLSLL